MNFTSFSSSSSSSSLPPHPFRSNMYGNQQCWFDATNRCVCYRLTRDRLAWYQRKRGLTALSAVLLLGNATTFALSLAVWSLFPYSWLIWTLGFTFALWAGAQALYQSVRTALQPSCRNSPSWHRESMLRIGVVLWLQTVLISLNYVTASCCLAGTNLLQGLLAEFFQFFFANASVGSAAEDGICVSRSAISFLCVLSSLHWLCCVIPSHVVAIWVHATCSTAPLDQNNTEVRVLSDPTLTPDQLSALLHTSKTILLESSWRRGGEGGGGAVPLEETLVGGETMGRGQIVGVARPLSSPSRSSTKFRNGTPRNELAGGGGDKTKEETASDSTSVGGGGGGGGTRTKEERKRSLSVSSQSKMVSLVPNNRHISRTEPAELSPQPLSSGGTDGSVAKGIEMLKSRRFLPAFMQSGASSSKQPPPRLDSGSGGLVVLDDEVDESDISFSQLGQDAEELRMMRDREQALQPSASKSVGGKDNDDDDDDDELQQEEGESDEEERVVRNKLLPVRGVRAASMPPLILDTSEVRRVKIIPAPPPLKPPPAMGAGMQLGGSGTPKIVPSESKIVPGAKKQEKEEEEEAD
jgi:hypothetical protein